MTKQEIAKDIIEFVQKWGDKYPEITKRTVIEKLENAATLIIIERMEEKIKGGEKHDK